MTAATIPVPTELQPPPPDGPDDAERRRRPAPFSAILAALARLTSHAGEPSSTTFTSAGHAVAVSVQHREQYLAWRQMLSVAGVVITGDDYGYGCESHAVLHGWSMTVRLVGCS